MRPSATTPHHRARGFAVAAACCALLGGCGNPTPTGPASPDPLVAPSVRVPSRGTTNAETDSPDPGRWGAYGTRERACSAVTDDVVSLSLLPTTLSVNHRAQDVRRIEDRVRDVVEAAPPQLRGHFARIRDLVGSYGAALGSQNTASPSPGGSPTPSTGPGPGATSSPRATPPAPDFDDRALERSLEPVRQWLRSSCSDVVPPG